MSDTMIHQPTDFEFTINKFGSQYFCTLFVQIRQKRCIQSKIRRWASVTYNVILPIYLIFLNVYLVFSRYRYRYNIITINKRCVHARAWRNIHTICIIQLRVERERERERKRESVCECEIRLKFIDEYYSWVASEEDIIYTVSSSSRILYCYARCMCEFPHLDRLNFKRIYLL